MLKDYLHRQIATRGPMSVADYMATCLLHPEFGYYTTRDPLGVNGDFTTAPEISQMFGELLGLALAQSWLDQGAPARPLLLELGPGRGTLMQDMLRAMAQVPGFDPEIVLLEASPALRSMQARTLRSNDPRWIDSLDDLPEGRPLFCVANEFFDALPIRQFQREGMLWRERRIGMQDGNLRMGLAPPGPEATLAHGLADTQDGDVVEYCPVLPAIVGRLAQQIDAEGGAALIIDYGNWRGRGDTLQAVRDHQHADPLADPGQADLTAHVDFDAIARAAAPAHATRMTPQGVFLERLGITTRARKLARGLSGEALQSHIAAHHRLTHPAEMGTLFKIIGLYPRAAAPPPGLDP